MKPGEITKLEFNTESLKKLLTLLPPEKNTYKGLRLSTHYKICESLYKLWRIILVENREIPHEILDSLREYDDDNKKVSRLLLPIMAYYDYSCNCILSKDKSGKPSSSTNRLIPGFTISPIADFVKVPSDEYSREKVVMGRLSYHYLMSKSSLYFLSFLVKIPFLHKYYTFGLQSFVHNSVHGIYKFIYSNSDEILRIVAERMLLPILEDLKDIFNDNQKPDEYTPGIYSSLNLEELSHVASRNQVAIKKYGFKYLEKHFEQQLSLLMQSFGFFVISAKTGEKKADLFCFYSDEQFKFSFLLEAKTKSTNYNLPQSDIRALKEYIITTRQTLTTMPELKFVLIVGPKPSKTVASKIKNLESELNIAIRYIDVKNLVKLRENLPGPVIHKAFLNVVLSHGNILDEEAIKKISEYFFAQQQIHSEYVDKTFRLGDIGQEISKWPVK